MSSRTRKGCRKAHPTGLIVILARFGEGNRWKDVTEDVQGVVDGDSLTVPAGTRAFGDPAPGASGKRFQMTFLTSDNHAKNVDLVEGTTLQIGPRQTSIVVQGGGLINIATEVAELRRKHPTGLIILDARFGEGNRWKDVTPDIQDVVNEDSLTIPVGTGAFGDPAPSAAGKRFEMTYVGSDNQPKTIESVEGNTLQIGPQRTSIVAQKGGLINLANRLAEVRKAHPQGLAIIDASFGTGNQWVDVTDKVQSLVSGNQLNVAVNIETFSDPAPGEASKQLRTTYYNGQAFITVETPENAVLKVTSRTTSLADAAGKPLEMNERVEQLRKIFGDGLLILDAQWGDGNRWSDVREIIQDAVIDNAVSVNVGERWPDAAQSSSKKAKVTYWDGSKIQSKELEGGRLELRGTPPQAVSALKKPPHFIAEAAPFSHAFGGSGKFALIAAPPGVSLSPTGNLAWAPPASQVGPQELRISLSVAEKTYYYVAHIEVLSKQTVGLLGRVTGSLDATMWLDLGTAPARYQAGLGAKTGLVLQKNQLIVVNPDGITVKQRISLETEYDHIFERRAYYVAISSQAKRLDLLDKTTLRPIKSIKIPYRDVMDAVIHPTLPISYVSVDQGGDEGARFRAICVDEESGSAREMKNVVGNFLAIDPQGRRLYTGYKDFYQKGIELFMNPDGRIWDTPQYGTIDLLMEYELSNPELPRLMMFKERAGTNGTGLRVSPDGERITYLSYRGFPVDSGSVPAWDPTDLEKVPVTYDVKGRASATRMNYHPSLPLVAIPTDAGPAFFERESGVEQPKRAEFPASLVDAARVAEVYFSPDGLSALVLFEQGGHWWLRRVPLILSATERQAAQRPPSIAPPVPAPPPDSTGGLRGGQRT